MKHKRKYNDKNTSLLKQSRKLQLQVREKYMNWIGLVKWLLLYNFVLAATVSQIGKNAWHIQSNQVSIYMLRHDVY